MLNKFLFPIQNLAPSDEVKKAGDKHEKKNLKE